MDKGRHPHVVRTWTVERTRLPIRNAQPVRLHIDPRKEHFHAPVIRNAAASPPKKAEA